MCHWPPAGYKARCRVSCVWPGTPCRRTAETGPSRPAGSGVRRPTGAADARQSGAPLRPTCQPVTGHGTQVTDPIPERGRRPPATEFRWTVTGRRSPVTRTVTRNTKFDRWEVERTSQTSGPARRWSNSDPASSVPAGRPVPRADRYNCRRLHNSTPEWSTWRHGDRALRPIGTDEPPLPSPPLLHTHRSMTQLRSRAIQPLSLELCRPSLTCVMRCKHSTLTSTHDEFSTFCRRSERKTSCGVERAGEYVPVWILVQLRWVGMVGRWSTTSPMKRRQVHMEMDSTSRVESTFRIIAENRIH